jgi:5-(carboxyamino)imidazole ribonucleotide mutase
MILVIFGSKSDEKVYRPIIDNLKNFEFKICSAHRTPELLDQILKKEYNLIIAGAGLAAHLPGVIASKVIIPIIGIPCFDNYDGLDALLSIMQMPPGIPVLGVGVNKNIEAVRNSKLIQKKYSAVNIVENKECNPEKIEKIKEFFSELKITYKISNKINLESININLISLNNPKLINDETALVVNVPILTNSKASDSLKLLDITKRGLWVGLNRYENAAIACAQIMNLDNRFSPMLLKKREEMKNKIIEEN